MNVGHALSAVLVMCMLAVIAGSVHSAELGRLFLSPAERAALERARHEVEVEPVVTVLPEAPPEIAPATEEPALDEQPVVTVNGYVQRSQGPATVWINGVDSYQGDLSGLNVDRSSIRIRDGQVRVNRTTGETGFALKPGQTFTPMTQDVTDAYQPPTVEDAQDAP